MRDIRLTKLPRHDGPVTVEYLELVFRDLLGKFDPRNPNNDFAGAFVVANDGTATIGDDSRLASQRPLPLVNVGNRLSAQTTNPLSSTGTVSTASITIASHVLQCADFTVSYNGGTISGLTPLTEYFVYAQDDGWPDNAGGAVSYAATTSPATAVASKNRYYVGSIITANSTPAGTITNITQANPGVVTVTAHGFSSGNTILISGVVGMTQVNGNTYTITVLTADTFSIDQDTTAYTAYSSGGTATRVSSGTSGGGGGGWGFPIP